MENLSHPLDSPLMSGFDYLCQTFEHLIHHQHLVYNFLKLGYYPLAKMWIPFDQTAQVRNVYYFYLVLSHQGSHLT